MSNNLSDFTYGHYILTAIKKGDELKTREKDYLAAGAVNWASQISFDPQMVMVAVENQSDLNETIDYSEKFSLQVLGHSAENLIERFSQKSKISGNQINEVPFNEVNEFIHLEKMMSYIDCEVLESQKMGDHTLYFGKVVNQEKAKDEELLCTKETAIEYTS